MSEKKEINGEEERGGKTVINQKYLGFRDILSIIAVLIISEFLIGYGLKYFTIPITGIYLFIAYSAKFALAVIYGILLHKFRIGSLKRIVCFSFQGFDPILILWGLILTLSAGVVLDPLITLLPEKYMKILENAIGSGGWALITSIIAAPFFEELFFRGIIQEEISKSSGIPKGILTSSLIFGLVHIIPQQVITAFIVGIILGYIYVKTRSIISVIIIHAANNALAQFSLLMTGDITLSIKDIVRSDRSYYFIYMFSLLFLIIFSINFLRFCMTARVKT